MQKVQVINGRLLYASGEKLYIARGANIFHSHNNGVNWHLWARLPVNWFVRLVMRVPIFARLFRLGVHHLTFLGDMAVAIVNRESFLIQRNRVVSLGLLVGSRPLVLCATDDAVYYGEYRTNTERSAVHIWTLNFSTIQWEPVWSFEGVRHVHGVFFDPFTQAIWVTTGDSDEESALWCTDDRFTTLKKIIGGSQQLRTVQLLFSADSIYFGSDAPDEANYLYRMDRSSGELKKLVSVSGSVFFGCCVGENLFFSTVVEPSPVNSTRVVEVWHSVNGEVWDKVLQFKKDLYPMRYFQYGQVFFPNGSTSENILFCTPFATKSHGLTFKYIISSGV